LNLTASASPLEAHCGGIERQVSTLGTTISKIYTVELR
jgi:hypothetical protein